MTSLNPAYTIGEQIVEVLVRHRGLTRTQARDRAIDLLRGVRIPSPEQRVDEYPHKLSGGMRQRVMIAMALACDPQLLIADEPTTALDVTIQAQVLDLMRTLKEQTDAAIILISHDLGVVAEVCDEVAVMYAGEIVERAPVDELFEAPQHPYTIGPFGFDTAARSPRGQAGDDRRGAPRYDRFRTGLPLRAALSVCQRDLCERPAPHRGCRRSPLVALRQGAAGKGSVVTQPLLQVDGLVRAFRRAPFGIRAAHRDRQGCGRHRSDAAGRHARSRWSANPALENPRSGV